MASRHDWPWYGAALDYLRPRAEGLPSGVLLPTYLHAGYGFSGQHAGVLGPRYDPWHVRGDPAAADFRADDLRLSGGLSADQLLARRGLLAAFDRRRAGLDRLAAGAALDGPRRRAVGLLTSGHLAAAFDLSREPAAVRERYGRHLFGQSLLLARRLLEAGVPVVQASMGEMNHWDTHRAC